MRLGCPVVGVDDEEVAVVIKGGERIEADIVVGADGKSAFLSIYHDMLLGYSLSFKS